MGHQLIIVKNKIVSKLEIYTDKFIKDTLFFKNYAGVLHFDDIEGMMYFDSQ